MGKIPCSLEFKVINEGQLDVVLNIPKDALEGILGKLKGVVEWTLIEINPMYYCSLIKEEVEADLCFGDICSGDPNCPRRDELAAMMKRD